MANGVSKKLKCPNCNRLYASAGALAQHMQALHGAGPAPVVNTRPQRRKRNKAVSSGPITSTRRASGSDIVAIVTLTPEMVVGARLLELPLGPRHYAGTRMSAEASLWMRWRPIAFTLRVVTSAGGMVSGSYVVGWTPNPTERLPRGLIGVRHIASYVPTMQSQLGSDAKLKIPSTASQRWLIFGKDTEDGVHGVVHMSLSGPLASLATGSAVSLTVHLDWTLEFDGPDMPVDDSDDVIYADPGYDNYFTDSVSDWAHGHTLTLKHKEGGAAVPFTGAKPGIVYVLHGSAKLRYYNRTGQLADIKYGVRIPNYATPALSVFAEKEPAEEFAKEGDVVVCLPYVKAGPLIVPSNPPWETEDPDETFISFRELSHA